MNQIVTERPLNPLMIILVIFQDPIMTPLILLSNNPIKMIKILWLISNHPMMMMRTVVHSKCCNLARLSLASFNYFNGSCILLVTFVYVFMLRFYLVMWETLNSPCVFKITRIKYLCEGNLITILTMPEDLYNDESIIN